jgi:4-hydroxy-tetrahydrodipicolinate synthase
VPCPDGVYAACLTPLHTDLSIDVPTWTRHIRRLLDGGCTGVLLFGSTGEANSFSVAERQAGLEEVLDAGIPAERLMVGAGCAAVPDTVALTRHAVAHGIPGVLTMPPFYYQGITTDGAFAALEHIIRGVGADRLALYLYHFPKMSGVPYTHELITRLIDTFPDTIAGIKDSSSDWTHMRGLRATVPDLQLFAGNEVYLRDTLEAGGAGCISATVNVTHALAGSIFSQQAAGTADTEATHSAQAHLSHIRRTLMAHPTIPMLKQLMAWHTGHEGWQHLRPPLTPLGPYARQALQHAVADLELPGLTESHGADA